MTIRINKKLILLLDKVIEQVKKREGIDDLSYNDASLILYERIMAAGGLRENVSLLQNVA